MNISILLGALVGAILGLTGAGGGILAVPALVFGMHLTMQQAAPVALMAVAIGAAIGAIEGLRRGVVRYKAAVVMAISGVPITYLGQIVAKNLSQPVLLVCFASVMIVVAIRMMLQARAAGGIALTDPFAPGKIHPDTGKFVWNATTATVLASIGMLTGFMTGLLGVGGGFVIVPMLKKFTQVSMQGIVATSLLVIALVGAGGVATALIHGIHVPVHQAALFTVATAIGMLLGRKAIHHINAKTVQQLFSIVLLCVAVGLMAKGLLSF